jgi:UDP-N-acetylglucosamine 3-dehydrogenase
MLRAGVIGVGSMGELHARVYYELENIELTAVADTSPTAAKAISTRFGCKAYKDYKKLIENENLDIVSIVVPTELHKKISIDTMDAGIHTLVEKPISDNLDDAREIINAAKENGVKLAVGHIERFNPAVVELKRIVAVGRLGKISSVLAKRVGYFPETPLDINVLIEVGVHDIDIFNYILDKLPTVVYACGGKATKGKFREDYANVLLDYNGVSALLEVNWITPLKIRRLEVTGSKAFANLDYISQDLFVHQRDYSSDGIKTITEHVHIKKREPLKLELRHFAECVLNDKEPINSGESGYNAIKIAHDAIGFLNKNKKSRT